MRVMQRDAVQAPAAACNCSAELMKARRDGMTRTTFKHCNCEPFHNKCHNDCLGRRLPAARARRRPQRARTSSTGHHTRT